MSDRKSDSDDHNNQNQQQQQQQIRNKKNDEEENRIPRHRQIQLMKAGRSISRKSCRSSFSTMTSLLLIWQYNDDNVLALCV
mmetsp:Transcript_23913/g.26822  ORF Transcript_23913/g.26822 Transcript_23913/m.26822 type:complete len:82 (+) Transcript_23913:107-352(+)